MLIIKPLKTQAYNSNLFWNHTWLGAQWRASSSKITEVKLSAFVYRLFHDDFSPIVGTNTQSCIFVLTIGEKSS